MKSSTNISFTAQKMKFSIKDFFEKCDQIGSFMRIWSHLLKKPLMENFIFCAVIIYFMGGWLSHLVSCYACKTKDRVKAS